MYDFSKIRAIRNHEINSKVSDILKLVPPNACVTHIVEEARVINNGVIDKSSIHSSKKVFYLEDKPSKDEFRLALREAVISSYTMSIVVIANNIPVVYIDKKELVSFLSRLATIEYKFYQNTPSD